MSKTPLPPLTPGLSLREVHQSAREGLEHQGEQALSTALREALKKKPHDAVTAPTHYNRWKMEPVTFIMVNEMPFWMGNVIKYIMRADAKDGLQDLEKAKRYIDFEINRLKGEQVVQ
jgi:hypothetical protein